MLENQLHPMVYAKVLEAEAQMVSILENNENKKELRIDKESLALSTESLQESYPQFTSSLLNLIKQTELIIK